MFRASLQQTLRRPFLGSQFANQQSTRKQSTSSSSGGQAFALVTGAVVATVGGTVFAAKYNDNFRKKVEDTVPYSGAALNSILGPKDLTPVKAVNKDPIKAEESLLKKKLEREVKNQPPQKPATPAVPQNAQKQIEKMEQKPLAPVEPKIKEPEFKTLMPPEPLKSSVVPTISAAVAGRTLEEASEKKEDKVEPRQTEYVSDDSENARVLARRKKELENEYQRKVNGLKEDLEVEIRTQLKRQVAAHLDHLREQLEVQRFDLERQFTMVMEEKLLDEKSHYASQLIENMVRLREIETVLKNRQQLDIDEKKARELWLICEILKDGLKSKRCQSDQTPSSFANDINAIKESVKSMETQSTLVSTVLETVPENALHDGVYTEDDLIERFKTINKMCKRVALIGDEGGSISKYLLSYLQSVLLFENNACYSDELSGKTTVDPSTWDTYDILSRVRYCLNERNLDMCLKYANQLQGKPRQVAKDWINDLRVHLELKQVADVLQAHAASTTIRAVK
ncbi:MICOS complex subunit MIC60-like protein [Leptotrombidium deliense]|uniref:MICOS complex subunit MIC60 n=1 Tax=Leptotrombidium deliense TaxID=299467 RepID=A0A443ST89_9ACAR|nr:MICOS complex subunit MIC60-like protein [Leptotrombidium deliense]